MITPADLVNLWRNDSRRLNKLGQKDTAALITQLAFELEVALDAEARREVTIAEAAELSGYKQDTLRRMIADGQLPARKDGGRYLVAANLLPRKAPSGSVVNQLAALRQAKGPEAQ